MKFIKVLRNVVCLSLLFTGCLELPIYEEIDKLRVLALRADNPQIAVGETASMEALVVTPDDAKAALSWQLCAYVRGADKKRTCPKEALLKRGTGDRFDFAIDDETAAGLRRLCHADKDIARTFPEDAEWPECTAVGYPLVVRLVAKTANETAVAVKKVALVSTLPVVSLTNPVIAGFKGLPKKVRAGGTYRFGVLVEGAENTDGDAQDSGQEDGGSSDDTGTAANVEPAYRFTWFLRGGDGEYLNDHMDEGRKERLHLKVKKNAKQVTVWIVVRDSMYGVDWRRLDFNIE